MDAQQLITEFLDSEHGSQALQALTQQGISEADGQQLLAQVAQAAHEHVEEQHQSQGGGGLLGEHAGKSFFAAFAAGMVRGDGFFKSLMEGGEGIMTGRVAESLAERAGVDSSTASTIAAAATPFVVAFLKQRLG